jgi:hypothetical protein
VPAVCGLTFELTPPAEAGRLARAVQHKPARRAGKLACRSGSGAERGVRHHLAADLASARISLTSACILGMTCWIRTCTIAMDLCAICGDLLAKLFPTGL